MAFTKIKQCARFLLGILAGHSPSAAQPADSLQVAFWNCENFFDTRHDANKDDYEFTPKGENHWNKGRYNQKRDRIAKTIYAMDFPAVMGLAEVENDYVMKDLCTHTILSRVKYEYIHYESPDKRGIDCALIYRPDLWKPFLQQSILLQGKEGPLETRTLLLAGGTTAAGNKLIVLVNHWPSKRGGEEAKQHRKWIARQVAALMDSLARQYPDATVLAMGDFNSEPSEYCISKVLLGKDENRLPIHPLYKGKPFTKSEFPVLGTYCYKGNWQVLDQMFLCTQHGTLKPDARGAAPFSPKFLLHFDRRTLLASPFRTYSGPHYKGGFSDHLPIHIFLNTK